MNQSQRVLVAGTGTSGIAVTKSILERGGDVVLYDGNVALKEGDIKEKFDKDAKVAVVPGEIKRSDLLGVELCIVSPGIPLDSPLVVVMDDAKVPVLGETELAYQRGLGRLAAIARTNRKTTITALTEEILETRYEETFMVGNIGGPYASKVLEMTEDSVTVAEVSSFQPETITDFRPNVNAILNITPDHLNRHSTTENYIRTKGYATLSQIKGDAVMLNCDGPVFRESGQNPELKPRIIWSSSREMLKDDFCTDGDNIVYCQNDHQTVMVNVHDMQLLGRHNHESAMAAAATALEMGVPMFDIARIIGEFYPVERRIEFVRKHTGVRYYNDFKGTSPNTVTQILGTMSGLILLTTSGYDKNSGYDEWVSELKGKVRYLVLVGQTRDKVAERAKKHGLTGIIYTEDMQEVV